MKVIPSNQTLLLASERSNPGTTSGATLARALNAASNGGVLRRLTIVAAEPDTSLVYVHADYTAEDGQANAPEGAEVSAHTAASANTALATVPRATTTSVQVNSSSGALVVSDNRVGEEQRDEYGNRKTASRDALSSYLKPTEQYARTQLMRGVTSIQPHVDVRV